MRRRLTSLLAIGWFVFLGSGLGPGPVAAKGTGVLVRELARAETSWDGALLPSYPEGQPEVRILSITIPPGTKLPVHQHPVINAGILLSGRLRVHTLDGQVLDLQAGEAIVEVVGTWHWGESLGDEPAHIVVFYAGTADLPITQTRE
ncbi:cupin domain-containing protein [Desulfonatronum lacustre]|uniref:cupin domain-containing protein n=1 Tax=Desulfonatronum lacustre TaxID=66849 RepID=UPI0004907426|nr:cupin domain-containing protein [Desulfonatronum lacustre]SMP66922.1 Cupin domain-containing protein [Desulfonatronum zhilinae]